MRNYFETGARFNVKTINYADNIFITNITMITLITTYIKRPIKDNHNDDNRNNF